MILPELHEKILDNNREKLSPPQLSEENINRIEELIKFAQHFQKPLLITYFKENRVLEYITFTFQLKPGLLECVPGQGPKRRIKFDRIIDVEIL